MLASIHFKERKTTKYAKETQASFLYCEKTTHKSMIVVLLVYKVDQVEV